MPDTAFRRRVWIVVPLLSALVVAAMVFSAWSLYASHSQACASRNTTLDVIHDILLVSTTPRPGQHVPPDQVAQLVAFRAAMFARIDLARC